MRNPSSSSCVCVCVCTHLNLCVILYRTIGAMLAQVMNCRFIDADDYHPQANKGRLLICAWSFQLRKIIPFPSVTDKMKAGIPLSDEDRIPWLQTLRDTLRVSLSNGETIILGCSALQKHYREILRSADLDYIPGSASSAVTFVHLSVEAEVLAARLEKRGNHFMPAKLLQSQLDLLQMDESEGIHKVDASHHPQETLKAIQDLVKQIIINTTKS